MQLQNSPAKLDSILISTRRYFGRLGCLTAVLLVGSACLVGCEENAKKIDRPGGTMSGLQPMQVSMAMEGTVGSVAYAEGGLRLMKVRGYGLVTGLGNKGSRRCPESLRNYIVDSIRRSRMADPYRRKDGSEPSPEKMISSLDTAVVRVDAEIPAGAIKGRRFDVYVEAVDEETVSLAGGVLLPTELKVFQATSPTSVIEGQTLAHASGAIFMNPFRQASASAPTASLREGSIIAGGKAAVDRQLTLATTIESYTTTRQVQDAINARFRSDPPIAEAQSARIVTLKIPQEYNSREHQFLQTVMHLPLNNVVTELQARAKLLTSELSQPDAPHPDLALSLEGTGKVAIEFLRPLYSHPNRDVNFAAASAGVHLGDVLAMDVLIQHARDDRSPYRYQAIRELGESGMPTQATPTLRELLAGNDVEVRVLAYEALRQVDMTSVVKTVVGGRSANFMLELAPSSGSPLIYVRRTKAPRIAIIGGEQLMCRPPLLLMEDDSIVTLSAKSDDTMITVLRREFNHTFGPYRIPLSVPTLTRFLGDEMSRNAEGQLNGLGLDYGTVVHVLYQLCQSKAIPALIKWEEPTTDQLLGPVQPVGRPESEL